jgi:citrate lyase subunit beta / citryl-CoA lyase
MNPGPLHPRQALFGAEESVAPLPVCDHYAGIEARMRKALALQGELGPVFDVTLDCEDGAPIGGEIEHAQMAAEMVMSPANRHDRVGARLHPVDHACFEADVDTLIRGAGSRLAFLMLPKPMDGRDVERACASIDAASRRHGLTRAVPVHALIETHGALREVDRIAAHPRIESLSFGLMDFVSAHRGAIPAEAMGASGQFTHPLVMRAKTAIAAACHGHGKTPSHCVVTEFKDTLALGTAATRAAREFGYTRMWSIHPDQIRPIVAAFAPNAADIEQAAAILEAAQAAHWAPIRHADRLHDRASYRYFWQVLERASRTGQALPSGVQQAFFSPSPGIPR